MATLPINFKPMIAYRKISKSNRTIIATLLLLVFMAFVIADLFSSFIGLIILGLLLFQLVLEARMFLDSRKKKRNNL